MATWREIERDFREIPNLYASLRADWSHQDGMPNQWRLAGWFIRDTRDRFEALARLAGRRLLHSRVAQEQCPSEVMGEPDDLTRWLSAVKLLTTRFEHKTIGTLYDEDNRITGHLLMGTIDNVIEASALLCLKLGLEDESTEGNTQCKTRVHVDEIDSFLKVRKVTADDIRSKLMNGRVGASEGAIKCALEEILGVAIHQGDWGGEDDDLYTSNLILKNRRTPTAFALKGPGVRATILQLVHCGKNGDQIVRLFQAPAQLFVLQFIGSVSENIVKDMETKTRDLQSQGRIANFCIMDGQDTARLLYAYGKL